MKVVAPILWINQQMLAGADVVVLWLWNRFSIPRIATLRAVTLAWVAVVGVNMIHRDGHLPLPTLVFVVAALAVLAVEEWLAARTSARLMNTAIAAHRSDWLLCCWRCYILVWIIADCVLLRTAPPLSRLLTAGDDLLALGFHLFSWTFTPEEPPKPPRRVSKSAPASAIQPANG